jgi:hypothetical protein
VGCQKCGVVFKKVRSVFVLLRKFKLNKMAKTDWKSKSISQSAENKKLKKRNKELEVSRNQWKEKSIQHKARADKLESEKKNFKNKLAVIEIQ